MKINAVISKSVNTGKIKAYASVCIEDSIWINDIKVIEGKKGLFAAMPTRSYQANGQTQYSDICKIVNAEIHNAFQSAVLEAYRNYNTQVSSTVPANIPTAPDIAPEFAEASEVALPFEDDIDI